MKNFFNFITWGWKKLEVWQKLYVFAMILQIVGWISPNPYSIVFISIGLGIILSTMIKWFIWDSIKTSWKNYNKEKSQLFDTIKQSDLKS